MQNTYLLALDQGTTSSRAILFDLQGNPVSVAQKEFPQYYPQQGWVEHDAEEIWQSQLEVMVSCVRSAGIDPGQIAGIGITNQRETTILWDRDTGRPVSRAIVWQCRRTAPIIDDLNARGLGDMIRAKTGLVPDAYFSASKIQWILDHEPGLRQRAERGEVLFGTVDSWLIWKLTGGGVHATDRTNASRTMLYNIHTLEWDGELLRLFRIPRPMLPEVLPSGSVFGHTELLGKSIPIAGAAGDQQAALFGQCCFAPGEVKNTYGTGCFMLMNTGSQPVESKNGLLTTLAASPTQQAQYALEGSVFIGGAVIQWLRDEMRLFSDSPDAEYLASKVPDNGGVYFVPAFTGLGAPHWDMYARGSILGITRGTRREHIIRAAQESIAYQSADLYRAMVQDTGLRLPFLNVDGGASRDSFLMQFQADILDCQLRRPATAETTALGAAFLAGLTVGCYPDLEGLRAMRRDSKVWTPNMIPERRAVLVAGWNKAVGRSLGWAEA